jgi:hypothetical protein
LDNSIFNGVLLIRLYIVRYFCCIVFTDSFHPNDGGDTFLRNVGSYKTQTTTYFRRLQILHSINWLGCVLEM